jgi:hypothetical protein
MAKPDFHDVSPRTGVYEGDLKFGRCLGSTPVKKSDHSAERAEDGEAKNKPIAPLVPAFKRDQTFWRGRNKHPKRTVNSPTLADDILVQAAYYPQGLISNLTMFKSNNQILLAGR